MTITLWLISGLGGAFLLWLPGHGDLRLSAALTMVLASIGGPLVLLFGACMLFIEWVEGEYGHDPVIWRRKR